MRNARLLKTFIDLLKIDSPSCGEKKAAEYIKRRFKGRVKVIEDNTGAKIDGNCGNLILKFSASEKKTLPLIFVSHLDTVTSTKNIKLKIKNGVISTDGSTILGADDKVGVAAMIELGLTLSEQEIDHGDIYMIFTVGEEKGLLGVKNLQLKEVKARHAFVLDAMSGPVGSVVVGAPTMYKLKIEIFGKAAHSGIEPEKAVNAITIAAKSLNRLKSGRLDKYTTANFGKIKGGVATNVVPDHVVIEGEIRSLRDKIGQQRVNEIKNEFEKAAKKMGGKVNVKVHKEFTAFDLSKDESLKIIKKAAVKCGLKYATATTCGGSDANILNQRKFKAVVLSLNIQSAHSKEERYKLSNLFKLNNLILEIAKTV